MVESGSYRIRPAGRHILTIGRDLVQDPHAAVIELVKNAYDADSQDVHISFERQKSGRYVIIVADHGHGMTREVVINEWMVPSTADKEKRYGKSPNGRTMQGRKGIGRYATSILGNDLLLETVTSEGEKTTLYLEWSDFEDAAYLGDVEILIETVESNNPQGTTLMITLEEAEILAWRETQFDKLLFELRKLKPPFENPAEEQEFTIRLKISGILEAGDKNEIVKPYPLIKYFDYKIAGCIRADGNCELVFSQQKSRSAVEEEVTFNLPKPTGCGDVKFDIRVYDRDPESLNQLIQRGLKHDAGNYFGKLEARQLLNEYNGIGVYRNGFRLRPLGDPEFDWLKLNEQRIQTPALRIGSNQVIGYVEIESEELSHLTEKSARDGLIENDSFLRLREITKEVIRKLEERRYVFRQKTGLSRKTVKVERELERLYSLDSLKSDVLSKLENAKVKKETTSEVIKLIESEELRHNEAIVRLRDAIAIYQGQATLGRIINVVLHEGRRPLSYFRNHFPILRERAKEFASASDSPLVSEIVAGAKGISDHAAEFVTLFSRLDPLAAQRRSKRKKECLAELVNLSKETLMSQIRKREVTFKIKGDLDLLFLCWRQDIQTIFTNLIDNSLYWLGTVDQSIKRIDVRIESENGFLSHVDYRDNGPGVDPKFIEDETIFDPHFSTKPGGTGLGLAIAGEAASRNRLDLTVLEFEDGAWFRLQPKKKMIETKESWYE